MPSGSIATLGGWDPPKGEPMKEIYVLNEKWTITGKLLQGNYYGSANLVDETIYVFPGNSLESTRMIQRVKLGKVDQKK